MPLSHPFRRASRLRPRGRGVTMLLGVLMTAGALVGMSTAASASSPTVSPRLTAKWWQWSISMPATNHPFADPTTNDCTYNQSGRTWYLGGVFNASGTVTRDCHVPKGVSLLVPAVNVECSDVEPPPFYGATPKERRACAQGLALSDPFVSVDGHRVPICYVTSGDFGFHAPADNVLGVPGPVSGRSVSAGWWALIPPLSRGAHTLHFGGTFPDFAYTLDITYNLTVG